MLVADKPTLGLRHAAMVFTSPRRVFSLVEDTGAYGWALATLLVLVMLVGVATVQTGLIDADVDRQTEKQRAAFEEQRGELVDRVELRESFENIAKTGEFNKTILRIGVIGLAPIEMIASFLLISSVLYAVVALTGHKPEWHTLMSICVYAGFIELAAYVLRLVMMLYYRTSEVSTSLAGLDPADGVNLWAAVDPFRIWFWVLVVIGLTVTRQLKWVAALASCLVMFIATHGVRVGLIAWQASQSHPQ